MMTAGVLEGWLDRVRPRLRRLFAHRYTDWTIGFLIVVSVTLTVVELSLAEGAGILNSVERANYLITAVFAIELTLRFVAESDRDHHVRRYLRRWWLDLLAVVPLLLPLLESFRILRGLRILRYLRLLRVGRLFSGVINFLPYVVRRGAIHLSFVVFLLLVTVALGTSLVLSFERLDNPDISNFGEAFWFSLYSLFAGEPVPGPPATIEGRIASVAVLFMGLLIFAAFTGTISAFMIERLQKEGHGMGKGDRMEDHIILCGLGQVGHRVLQVLRRLGQEVLVIEREESEFVDHARAHKVPVIIQDVRRPNVLVEAGVARARAVVACTDSDLTNLEIAIDARHERPDIRVVLRLFDQRLAVKVAEGFNIQVAFCESALAAPAFAAAAIDRSVRGSLEVEDRVYIQCEFAVPTGSALAGKTVSQLRDEYEVHTLMFRTEAGNEVWSPAYDVPIPERATIVVIGPFDKIARLKLDCGVVEDLVKALLPAGT